MASSQQIFQAPAHCEHLVQFYGADPRVLVANVSRYISDGLDLGEGGVLIATRPNILAVTRHLNTLGPASAAAIRDGRLVFLDAEETLRRFMVGESPDPGLFNAIVGDVIESIRSRTQAGSCRAYGEMVGILWEEGRISAAMSLEGLWNQLLESAECKLMCGYPIDVFGDEFQHSAIDTVIKLHTGVISAGDPAEIHLAIDRAMEDILGPAKNGSNASHLTGESRIVEIRKQHPDRAGDVLTRARRHYDSERRFRALIENSSDAIALLDEAARVVYASPSTARILGYEPGDLRGCDTFGLVHPEDRDRIRKVWEEALSLDRCALSIEARFRARDGGWRWIEGTLSNLVAEPDIRAIVLNYRDITQRKEAEDTLRASERRLAARERHLAAVLDAIPECVKVLGPAGEVLQMNHAGLRMVEADSAEDVLGKCVYPLIDEPYRAAFQAVNEGVFEGQPGGAVEFSITGFKGGHRTFETRVVPLLGETDTVVGALSATRDITERKLAEADRDLLISVIEHSPDFVGIANNDRRIVYLNRAGKELAGVLGSREAAPTNILDYFSEDIMTVLDERGKWDGEVEFRNFETGELVPVLWNAFTIPDSKTGKTKAYACVSRNISERKRAENALRTSEERYRSLIQAITSLVWRADAHGNFIEPQPHWQSYTGQTWERQQNSAWMEAIHPDDRAHVAATWTKALRSAARETWEQRLWHEPSKRYRPCVAAAVPIKDEAGQVREWVGTITDVAEQKLLEEKLREAAKLESLGVLAGGIAHDFNNLLTGILGSASLILEDAPSGSALYSAAETISQASERASQLTRQMLAYSGRGHFVVEPLNLSAQVRQILALLKASIPKHVQLILDLDDARCAIRADAGQLQQLVMNLAINAAEATSLDGVVSVRTSVVRLEEPRPTLTGELVPGQYVALEVRDNGTGMDEGTKKKIFEPFFTTKFTGRGLGLAAVLGIVRGHKAGLEVESQPKNGSVFTVLFPLSGARAGSGQPDAAAGGGHGTIVIVDDEEIVLRTAALALERRGFRVLTFADGFDAVSHFRQSHADIALAILDMTMPGMSGAETLKALREIDDGVPVLGSSGYSAQEAQRQFGTGLSGFLQKPYTMQRLSEAVVSLMAKSPRCPDAQVRSYPSIHRAP